MNREIVFEPTDVISLSVACRNCGTEVLVPLDKGHAPRRCPSCPTAFWSEDGHSPVDQLRNLFSQFGSDKARCTIRFRIVDAERDPSETE
jgi:hypothetical protein